MPRLLPILLEKQIQPHFEFNHQMPFENHWIGPQFYQSKSYRAHQMISNYHHIEVQVVRNLHLPCQG